MTRAISILVALTFALIVSGCAVRCGPVHTVPAQKLHIIAPSPMDYAIRVTAFDRHTDHPVPADGRVSFDVPIGSRYCTPYLFGVIKAGWPAPVEERRVIRVMRGGSVVRRMSASDISRLDAGADGFRILRIKR